MEVIEVLDLDHFLNLLNEREMESGNWAFRGVPDPSFELVPSVGRKSVRSPFDADVERFIFERFKLEARPHLTSCPSNATGWLALARHSGLPTRLLDWTVSPLVAGYFATSELGRTKKSGFAIYAYESAYYELHAPIDDPFSLDEDVVEIHADHFSERMSSQRGFFTCHRHPDKEFDDSSLKKFIFPADTRDDMLGKLDLYGVNRASLFPGLDGLAGYWGWFYKIGGVAGAAATA